MDPRLSLLTLVSAVLAALTRALNVDTTFATWSKKLRAVVVLAVGTAQAVVDNVVAGTAAQMAILAALTTTAPSFVILFVEWMSDLKSGGGAAGGSDAKSGGSSGPGGKPTEQPTPYGMRMVAFALGVTVAGLSGCASAIPTINKIQAAVAQAPLLIEVIRAAETLFFMTSPNPVLQSKIERDIADAALAADAANNALIGAQDISSGDSKGAFEAWNKAYDTLLVTLREAHVIVPSQTGTFMVGITAPGRSVRLPLHPISADFK